MRKPSHCCHFRLPLLIVSALACAFAHSAPETASERLSSLQALYAKHHEAIETDYTKKLATWPQSYAQQVQRLQKKLQQAGDLDNWARARDEISRFTEKRVLDEDDLVAALPELRTIQITFRDLVREFELDRNRQLVTLASQYIARVEEYQTQLTKQGLMDDAMAYNAEIKRIRTSPEVTAATFDLAEYELMANPPEASEEPLEDNAASGSKLPVVQAASPDGTVVPGAMVFSGPLPSLDERPRRILLKPTDRAKTMRGLSARAALHQQASSYAKTDDYGSRYKYEKTQNTVYLSLRSASEETAVTMPYVVVEVYSKDITGKGAVNARREHITRVRLERLGTDWMTIATPYVSITRYTKDSRYSSAAKGGREFYGVVVSVFDGDGALVYQGFEGNALEKNAPDEVPKEEEHERMRRKLDTARLHVWAAKRKLAKDPLNKDCTAALESAKETSERALEAWSAYLNPE